MEKTKKKKKKNIIFPPHLQHVTTSMNNNNNNERREIYIFISNDAQWGEREGVCVCVVTGKGWPVCGAIRTPAYTPAETLSFPLPHIHRLSLPPPPPTFVLSCTCTWGKKGLCTTAFLSLV
eukprot:Rhum_TRINITY_DN14494_c30_g1::Rhum_TRINITY_DN14494_c30_g1_i1::g.93048::m.93048